MINDQSNREVLIASVSLERGGKHFVHRDSPNLRTLQSQELVQNTPRSPNAGIGDQANDYYPLTIWGERLYSSA